MRQAARAVNKALSVAGIEIGPAGQSADLASELSHLRNKHDAMAGELRAATEARDAAMAERDVYVKNYTIAMEQRDQAYESMKRFGAVPYPDELYAKLFPAGSLERKRFYNIGSGNWRHPYWTNIDYDSTYYDYASSLIDINWDISQLQPLPIDTGSAELVYSSHTVEHLQDHHVDHMLAEAHRILKPGGVARVTTPNAELVYWAVLRRDGDVYRHFGEERSFFETPDTYTRETMPLWLVNEIASQLHQGVGKKERANALYRDKHDEVQQILASLPMTAAFDNFTSKVDFGLHRRAPGHHVSWWSNGKLRKALERAGFKHTVVSVAGGSVSPVMRNRSMFDNQLPTYSIFVEGIRD